MNSILFYIDSLHKKLYFIIINYCDEKYFILSAHKKFLLFEILICIHNLIISIYILNFCFSILISNEVYIYLQFMKHSSKLVKM